MWNNKTTAGSGIILWIKEPALLFVFHSTMLGSKLRVVESSICSTAGLELDTNGVVLELSQTSLSTRHWLTDVCCYSNTHCC